MIEDIVNEVPYLAEVSISALVLISLIVSARVAYKFLDVLGNGITKLIDVLGNMTKAIEKINDSITEGTVIDEKQTKTINELSSSVLKSITLQKEIVSEQEETTASVKMFKDLLTTNVIRISQHFDEIQAVMKTHDVNAQSRNKSIVSILEEMKVNMGQFEKGINKIIKQSSTQ